MKATLRGRAPLVLLLAVGVAAVNACAAAGTDAADEAPGAGAGGGATGGASGSGSGATSGASGNGGNAAGGGSAGDGGSAGSGASSGSGGDAGSGQGGGASGSAGSGSAGKSGGPGACGNACGPVELCDPDHLGFDDNCDGQVDEGCPCTDGQSHWCFKGDPSYRGSSGCFDGTERCSGGVWGACQGGKHGLAGEDSCLGAAGACIDLQASPFAKVKLGDGTKGFAGDADPGSHKYQVTCPSGVQSCPQVKDPTSASASFQPLQSGQYNVVYSKTVGGVPQSCNYAVYVAGEGLRVELSWDNVGVEGVTPNAAKGPDLDLHVHRPSTTTNWLFAGTGDDCFFGNCRIDNFAATGGPGDPVGGPSWFADAPAPSPHNWTKHAEDAKNSCYFAPRGVGNQWKALGKGCHNPRLDLDNFGCEAGITDPDDPSFCAPENVNFDELPDKTWVRIAAHYFGSCTKTLPTHPLVTVYCNGGQVAQLGSKGGMPLGYSEPVTMQPADCQKKMWLAADVYVKQGTCSIECTVVPLHEGASKKPLVVAVDGASAPFGPGYPAAP